MSEAPSSSPEPESNSPEQSQESSEQIQNKILNFQQQLASLHSQLQALCAQCPPAAREASQQTQTCVEAAREELSREHPQYGEETYEDIAEALTAYPMQREAVREVHRQLVQLKTQNPTAFATLREEQLSSQLQALIPKMYVAVNMVCRGKNMNMQQLRTISPQSAEQLLALTTAVEQAAVRDRDSSLFSYLKDSSTLDITSFNEEQLRQAIAQSSRERARIAAMLRSTSRAQQASLISEYLKHSTLYSALQGAYYERHGGYLSASREREVNPAHLRREIARLEQARAYFVALMDQVERFPLATPNLPGQPADTRADQQLALMQQAGERFRQQIATIDTALEGAYAALASAGGGKGRQERSSSRAAGREAQPPTDGQQRRVYNRDARSMERQTYSASSGSWETTESTSVEEVRLRTGAGSGAPSDRRRERSPGIRQRAPEEGADYAALRADHARRLIPQVMASISDLKARGADHGLAATFDELRVKWRSEPSRIVGDLEWMNGQIQALARREDERSRERSAVLENPDAQALAVRTFDTQSRWGENQVRIVVPPQYRHGQYERGSGVILINAGTRPGDLRFYNAQSENLAHAAGIRAFIESQGRGNALRVEFTKSGLFECQGEQIAVQEDGEHSIERDLNNPLHTIDMNFGTNVPRFIDVRSNGERFFLDPRMVQPDKPMHGAFGISIRKHPSGGHYNYQILFTQPGEFELLGIVDATGRVLYNKNEVVNPKEKNSNVQSDTLSNEPIHNPEKSRHPDAIPESDGQVSNFG